MYLKCWNTNNLVYVVIHTSTRTYSNLKSNRIHNYFPVFSRLYRPLFPWSPRSLAGIQMSASLSSPINNEISYILRQRPLNTWWWRPFFVPCHPPENCFQWNVACRQRDHASVPNEIFTYWTMRDTSGDKQSRVDRVVKTKAKESECKHVKGREVPMVRKIIHIGVCLIHK